MRDFQLIEIMEMAGGIIFLYKKAACKIYSQAANLT